MLCIAAANRCRQGAPVAVVDTALKFVQLRCTLTPSARLNRRRHPDVRCVAGRMHRSLCQGHGFERRAHLQSNGLQLFFEADEVACLLVLGPLLCRLELLHKPLRRTDQLRGRLCRRAARALMPRARVRRLSGMCEATSGQKCRPGRGSASGQVAAGAGELGRRSGCCRKQWCAALSQRCRGWQTSIEHGPGTDKRLWQHQVMRDEELMHIRAALC